MRTRARLYLFLFQRIYLFAPPPPPFLASRLRLSFPRLDLLFNSVRELELEAVRPRTPTDDSSMQRELDELRRKLYESQQAFDKTENLLQMARRKLTSQGAELQTLRAQFASMAGRGGPPMGMRMTPGRMPPGPLPPGPLPMARPASGGFSSSNRSATGSTAGSMTSAASARSRPAPGPAQAQRR